MSEQTYLVPALRTRAEIVPSTWNDKERTVDVTFASDQPVLRGGFFSEPFNEVLGCDDGEMRLPPDGRIAVMYGHGLAGLDSRMASELKRPQIGVATNIRTVKEGGVVKKVATVHFSERAEVADLVADVKAGIVSNISAGYRVHRMKDVTPQGEETRTNRVVDWTTKEFSFLPVRADEYSAVRSGTPEECKEPCVVIRSDESGDGGTQSKGRGAPMTEEEIRLAAERKAADDRKAAENAEAEKTRLAAADKAAETRGAEAERARIDTIRLDVRAAGLDEKTADELVRNGATVEKARADVLLKLRDRQSPAQQSPVLAVRVGAEARDHMRVAMQEVLEVKVGMRERKDVSELAKKFVGCRMLRMVEELERAALGRDPDDLTSFGLATRALAMSGSDFPKITENVANKALRVAYEAAQPTYRRIARQNTVADFKPMSRVQIGLGSQLTQVQENGEVSYSVFSDSKETYQLATFGKLAALTRRAIINDDTSAFDRVPRALGQQTAIIENVTAWNLFTANSGAGVTMGDSVALFNAAHNNDLAGGNALAEASLTSGRASMRKQKDPDGTILNLNPRHLIVPAALETAGFRNVIAPVAYPSSAAGVSPFAGLLDLVVEPLLDASSASRWYLAAGIDQIDILEYSYLEGSQGPMVQTFFDPKFDGILYRVLHDFNVGVVEFRGLIRLDA